MSKIVLRSEVGLAIAIDIGRALLARDGDLSPEACRWASDCACTCTEEYRDDFIADSEVVEQVADALIVMATS